MKATNFTGQVMVYHLDEHIAASAPLEFVAGFQFCQAGIRMAEQAIERESLCEATKLIPSGVAD